MDIETGNKLYKRIQDRYAAMKKIRLPFEPSWKEIILLVRPDLAVWEDEGLDKQGKKRNLTTYNATAQHDLLIWRDGLLGQIATQSLDWFYYSWPDKKIAQSKGVKEWLTESADAVALAMRDSNYYSHLGGVVWDGGSFGNAPAWIEADGENGIRCDTFHPREIWVQENAKGIVDGFVHGSFEISARDADVMFGKENLSDSLQNCLAEGKDPLTMFKFTEATFHKNDPIFQGISNLPGREWIKVAIQDETQPDRQKPLLLEGYFSKPFTYWRMFDTPGSVYSIGLAGFALVDIFGLNAITRSMLRAANIAVEPPFYVHSEMKGKVHIMPRGEIYGTRPEHRPEIVYDAGKYPFGTDREDRATQAIHRWFDIDFFLMLSNVDKVYTATQVMQMRNERAILLSPKIGRFQFDKLNQDHERIFDILYRQGKISPPPDVLLEGSQDGNFDVVYNGLLDRAQRNYREIEQLAVTMQQLEPIFAMSPEQRLRVKWDKLSKRILEESEAINEDEIATDEEYQAAIAAIQKQQAAMAQMQMAGEIAKAVPSLQKKTEPTSPLGRLVAAGGAA